MIAKAGLIIGLDYDLPSLIKHRMMRTKVYGSATELPFAKNIFDVIELV